MEPRLYLVSKDFTTFHRMQTQRGRWCWYVVPSAWSHNESRDRKKDKAGWVTFSDWQQCQVDIHSAL